uniref:Uncharacterized protein n=1 Tax=Arundo donax TaxID=35708 RepID=A0A0A9BQA1_ARUDO
MWSSGPSG